MNLTKWAGKSPLHKENILSVFCKEVKLNEDEKRIAAAVELSHGKLMQSNCSDEISCHVQKTLVKTWFKKNGVLFGGELNELRLDAEFMWSSVCEERWTSRVINGYNLPGAFWMRASPETKKDIVLILPSLTVRKNMYFKIYWREWLMARRRRENEFTSGCGPSRQLRGPSEAPLPGINHPRWIINCLN